MPEGVPTVKRRLRRAEVDPDQIIKTLVFHRCPGPARDRHSMWDGSVDRRSSADAAGSGKLKFAPAPVGRRYDRLPARGEAPVDLPDDAIVIVDQRVTGQPVVYGGSGTDLHMMRCRVEDVIRLSNNGDIPRIHSRDICRIQHPDNEDVPCAILTG